MGRRGRVTVLVAIALVSARAATAHAPYERIDRVITDSSGRQLQLVKSYVDGIVFTDPVKLVVRDAGGAAAAETDFGRDIAVLCWRQRECAVFRYDGFFPVVPANVWWLRESALVGSSSPWLRLLGIFVPFWEHWLGYLIALGLFFAPFALVKGAWRKDPGAGRLAFLSTTAVLAAGFLLLWLYVVVALSYLSLPLTAVLIVAALLASHAAAGRSQRRVVAVQEVV